MPIKVFKFGGASVASAEKIRNVAHILKQFPNETLLIIISAIGKTTNLLEEVADAYFKNKSTKLKSLVQQFSKEHKDIYEALLPESQWESDVFFKKQFAQLEKIFSKSANKNFDFYYDQIVSLGEIFSTQIVSQYLNKVEAIGNAWVDVREVIQTDDNYREGIVDWKQSLMQTQKIVKPLLQKQGIVITQGFIGRTPQGHTTTLGREGSDYTAAIFSNLLDAESQTIWKDVVGVMNCDPKYFPEAQYLPELSYEEVLEMAYYGAQVIHPKTLKPLQNKNIPLFVKCFLDYNLIGTAIKQKTKNHLPPIIVVKRNQTLITFSTKDLSFIEETPIREIHQTLVALKLKPNLTFNEALRVSFLLDITEDKYSAVTEDLAKKYDIHIEKNLSLLTIRHYKDMNLEKLVNGKTIIFKQQSTDTLQMILK